MADDSLESQLRRLAALVAPLAETVNRHDMLLAALAAAHLEHAERLANHDARLADHQARMGDLAAIVVRLDATIERLDRLIARVFRDHPNGPND